MRKLLVLGALCGTVVTAASAAPITPFSIYGGYFRGGSFNDQLGNRVHMSGFEVGLQQSLVSLPILGAVDLGVSVVFSGTDGGGVHGNLYRVYANYKTPAAPGTSVYGIAGFAYSYANGSSFSTESGLGTEFGIGFPLKLGLPGAPGAAIEARYRQGRAAATGFSIGLNVSF